MRRREPRRAESKRKIIVRVPRSNSYSGTRLGVLGLIRTSWLGSISLLSRAQDHQITDYNLSPVFLFCALPVFPTCSLEFAFDIQVRAFGYKLAHNLGKFPPDHDVVPFAAILEFAA